MQTLRKHRLRLRDIRQKALPSRQGDGRATEASRSEKGINPLLQLVQELTLEDLNYCLLDDFSPEYSAVSIIHPMEQDA